MARRLLRKAPLHAAAWWLLVYAAAITPLTALAGWRWKQRVGDALSPELILRHDRLGFGLVFAFLALAIWRYAAHRKQEAPGMPYLPRKALLEVDPSSNLHVPWIRQRAVRHAEQVIVRGRIRDAEGVTVKRIQQLELELEYDVLVNCRVFEDTEILVRVFRRTHFSGYARHVAEAECAKLSAVRNGILIEECAALRLANRIKIEQRVRARNCCLCANRIDASLVVRRTLQV